MFCGNASRTYCMLCFCTIPERQRYKTGLVKVRSVPPENFVFEQILKHLPHTAIGALSCYFVLIVYDKGIRFWALSDCINRGYDGWLLTVA